MALIEYTAWSQQLYVLGTVKASSAEDALLRAKKRFPHCVAPIVQSTAESKEERPMRYLTGYGFRSGGSKWVADQFGH